jgi:hypothetical protein
MLDRLCEERLDGDSIASYKKGTGRGELFRNSTRSRVIHGIWTAFNFDSSEPTFGAGPLAGVGRNNRVRAAAGHYGRQSGRHENVCKSHGFAPLETCVGGHHERCEGSVCVP